MAIEAPWSPSFDRAECRRRYEHAFEQLLASSANLPAASFVLHFIELEALLDDGMVEVKTAMHTGGLLSTEHRQELGAWIYRQHRNLMKVGVRALHAVAAGGKVEPARALRVLALVMLHYGESVKWELIVGRHEPREHLELHAMMGLALSRRRQRQGGELVVDGLQRWASIEHLYLRALLLDRFTSGTLTSEQIEVLDAWLWEWAKVLRCQSRDPGGLVLRADLDRNTGLEFGRRPDKGPSLYLALAPLEDLRRSVIAGLHRGHVFPRQGRAADIPLEAHVAVLLQLRALFAGRGSAESPRAGRHRPVPVKVEVYVGTSAIVAALRGGKSAPAPRFFTPLTASASGYLFVVPEKVSDDVGVGALVALRLDPKAPLVLGQVVRRVHELGVGLQVGVQVMSDAAEPVTVATLESEAGRKDEFLFVPGADRSGRYDSFAVSYRLLRELGRYRVRAGNVEYTLSFNRVHRRGRGWALAGFEILGAESAAA